MTRTVWKYTVDFEDGIDVDPVFDIPEGGRFLTIKDRTNEGFFTLSEPHIPKFDMWFAVETDNPLVKTQFHIRGTGTGVPPSVTYLGTIFPLPSIVMHVWQKDKVFEDMNIVDGKFVPRSQ